VHSLRGASGLIGIVGIQDDTAELEAAILSEVDASEIFCRADRLESRLAVICQAIDGLKD